jgi:hypothetical protein
MDLSTALIDLSVFLGSDGSKVLLDVQPLDRLPVMHLPKILREMHRVEISPESREDPVMGKIEPIAFVSVLLDHLYQFVPSPIGSDPDLLVTHHDHRSLSNRER